MERSEIRLTVPVGCLQSGVWGYAAGDTWHLSVFSVPSVRIDLPFPPASSHFLTFKNKAFLLCCFSQSAEPTRKLANLVRVRVCCNQRWTPLIGWQPQFQKCILLNGQKHFKLRMDIHGILTDIDEWGSVRKYTQTVGVFVPSIICP